MQVWWGWRVTDKLVRNWVSYVWRVVTENKEVRYIMKFLHLQDKAENQIHDEIHAEHTSNHEFPLHFRCRNWLHNEIHVGHTPHHESALHFKCQNWLHDDHPFVFFHYTTSFSIDPVSSEYLLLISLHVICMHIKY